MSTIVKKDKCNVGATLDGEDRWFIDLLNSARGSSIKTIVFTKTKIFILGLEHRTNSLTLYCRLCNLGVRKEVAFRWCKGYEIVISRRIGRILDSFFRILRTD